MRLLLVEDEKKVAQARSECLQGEWDDVVVEGTGAGAVSFHASANPEGRAWCSESARRFAAGEWIVERFGGRVGGLMNSAAVAPNRFASAARAPCIE